MTAAKLAQKLTAAGLKYTTHNHDGVAEFRCEPRLDWDSPVSFMHFDGNTSCTYGAKDLTVRDGIATARITCVRVA